MSRDVVAGVFVVLNTPDFVRWWSSKKYINVASASTCSNSYSSTSLRKSVLWGKQAEYIAFRNVTKPFIDSSDRRSDLGATLCLSASSSTWFRNGVSGRYVRVFAFRLTHSLRSAFRSHCGPCVVSYSWGAYPYNSSTVSCKQLTSLGAQERRRHGWCCVLQCWQRQTVFIDLNEAWSCRP